jgi:hypothetical protein
VLAVLAFAGLRPVDQRSPEPPSGKAASGQLAGQPAPEPELPAIVNVAVTTSVTVHTQLVAESCRHLRPARSVFTVTLRTPVVPDDTARPRSFPLLI